MPVKLSVKSDYAARAVLGLALHPSDGRPVRIEALASDQAIPANFLVQILIDLKAHGIVRSVRGKNGGYFLARPSSAISMGDVLRAVHGQVFETPALSSEDCPPELRQVWERIRAATEGAADSISFQHIAEASADRQKMYYI
jgi:Rrf2 family protein